MGRSLSNRASNIQDVYARLTFAAGVLFLGIEIAYLSSARSLSVVAPPIDGSGFVVGRDFINSWMAGRCAFSGGPAAWFDLTAYNAALQDILGRPDFPHHFWSYPPHIMLLLWPLGLLPYLPAYLLWCIVGLALYLLAAEAGGAPRKDIVFLALAPAVAVNAFFGQNGFLTAALLIGGLANLDRRPTLSGLLFGVLTIKPQFALLLPVLLVLTGRWRVIAVAVATTAVLVAVTSLWFGPGIWLDYVREVMPQQHEMIVQAGEYGWPMVSSAFVNARLVGLPADWAWGIQALTSVCALALTAWTFWRRRDAVLSLALFITATFLFSPWMLNYDMVVFGYVIALMRERTDNTIADDALAIAVWTLPATMFLFGAIHVPIAMLVLPAFAGRLVWRLGQRRAREAVATGPTGVRFDDLAAPETT